jgi:antitoxin YokJ
MSEIETLVNTMREPYYFDECEVDDPAGDPVLQSGHALPEDLAEFYRLCGGLYLFAGRYYPVTISTPKEFVLANPVIFDGISQAELNAPRDDISWC